MKNTEASRVAVLAAYLAQHYPNASPHAIAITVVALRRAARSAVGWELHCCSVPMDEVQQLRGRQRINRLQDKLNSTMLIWRQLHESKPSNPHPAPATVSLGGAGCGPCAYLRIPGQSNLGGWCDELPIT